MIDTIKKLLKEANINEVEELLNFEKNVNSLKDPLEKILITNKEGYFSRFNSLLEAYRIYFFYPELVSKKMIGILGFNQNDKFRFYREVMGINFRLSHIKCSKVISYGDKGDELLNYLDKKIPLTRGVLKFLNNNKKIDAGKIINFIKVYSKGLRYKNIGLFETTTPDLIEKKDLLDQIIIFPNSDINLKSILKKLNNVDYIHEIIVIKNERVSESCLRNINKKYINVRVIKNLLELSQPIEKIDIPVDKVKKLKLLSKIIIEDILKELNDKKAKYNIKRNHIEKLLLFDKNKELEELSLKLKKNLSEVTDSLGKLKILENEVQKTFGALPESSNNSDNEIKYILTKKYIINNKKDLAKKNYSELLKENFKKSLYLDYLIRKANSYPDLFKLSQERDLDIKVALLKLPHPNYLSNTDLIKEVIGYTEGHNIDDKDAYRRIGDYYYNIKEISKAEDAYRKAIKLGCQSSGSLMYNIYKQKGVYDMKSLKFLSNNLVKEACLDLGIFYLENGKMGLAASELKKGAILGCDSCFYELGVMHLKNNKLATFFFMQIQEKNRYWNDLAKECISKYYYYENMFGNLEEFSEKTEFPLSYFFLGKLLEKGGNEKKALTCYKKARDIEQGERNYQRLNNYITRKNNQSYNSRNSYSSTYSGGHSSSSGWCFITTATCLSLEKDDNCYELTTFRNFRDSWLAYEINGKEDIKKYYELAPKIVSNINSREDSKVIYNNIWEKFLSKCLLLIETNKLNEARYLYEKMVKKLSKEYL